MGFWRTRKPRETSVINRVHRHVEELILLTLNTLDQVPRAAQRPVSASSAEDPCRQAGNVALSQIRLSPIKDLGVQPGVDKYEHMFYTFRLYNIDRATVKRDLTRRLLLYIVDQLQDMEAQVSTIRLVKLLYLIDLDYFVKHKTTLTEINWVYHFYGPYFFELQDVLRSASIDLDAREFLSKSGRGYTFKVLEDQDISKHVDFATEQLVNRIIKRCAFEDTRALLDFVYGTPPIKQGQRGKPLDFSVLWATKEPGKIKRQISNPSAYRLMLASESTLAKEWDTPEDDEAWGYLSKKAK